MKYNRAYGEGFQAFSDGQPRSANDYDRQNDPLSWGAWDDGWLDAKNADGGISDPRRVIDKAKQC